MRIARGGKGGPERGKSTVLLKKFYLAGAHGLSDATERRYGVCAVFAIGSGSGSGWRSPSSFTPDSPVQRVQNSRTWSRRI